MSPDRERDAVLARLTPAEREALERIMLDAENAGTDWVRNELGMVIYAAARARRVGYHVPEVVASPGVQGRCL